MAGIAISLASLGGAAYLAYQSRHSSNEYKEIELDTPTTIDEILENGEAQITSEHEINETLEELHRDLDMEYEPDDFDLEKPLKETEGLYKN